MSDTIILDILLEKYNNAKYKRSETVLNFIINITM